MKTIERVLRVMTHVNIGATLGMAAWILWSGLQIVGLPSATPPPSHRPAAHAPADHSPATQAPSSHAPDRARPAPSDHCCLARAPVTT